MTAEESTGRGAAEPGWAQRIREAPLGVLVLGGVLFFLGAGFVLGGVYLAIARSDTGWVAWVAALLVGPAVLYVALHLLRLTRWAWLAIFAMLALLLASSVVRALSAPDFPLSPVAEIAAEAVALAYLARPRIRRAFGWA